MSLQPVRRDVTPTPITSSLRRSITFGMSVLVVLTTAMGTSKASADWPIHRGNPQRTGFREQRLADTDWIPAWISHDLGAPAPAWPAPARGSLWQNLDSLQPRVTDDHGDVPLIAADRNGRRHVLLASSSSDRLISIDPESGKQQWQFFANAPIRFAPTIHEGTAWFGADDGCIRAIDLSDGKVLWSQPVGPRLPWIRGNGRMISSHPIRTGVLLDGNVVFAGAGLFPSQGVYITALDAETGETLWRRRTMRSPQGYLLSDAKRRLYIPSGRANPFAVSMDWGGHLMECPSSGGSFCMVTKHAFFSGPGNDLSVESYRDVPDSKPLSIAGRAMAVGKGKLWTANGVRIACFDLQKHLASETDSLQWELACDAQQTLIVSGDARRSFVFAAGSQRIHVFDAISGDQQQILTIPESHDQIKYIAVAGSETGDLIVATSDSGRVYAWKGEKTVPSDTSWPSPRTLAYPERPQPTREQQEWVGQAIDRLDVENGMALVLNDMNGSTLDELLRNSSLQVVGVVNDATTCNSLRRSFAANGGYGDRVSVLHVPANETLPFADRMFNLVLDVDAEGQGDRNLQRLVERGTGVISRGGRMIQLPVERDAGTWRHQYGSPSNSSDSRDAKVGKASGFRLQWFGGVGPSRMPDRHLRGHAPLAAGSSLVMHGDNCLIGVDPANGIERWQLDLPKGTTRFVMPYDSGFSSLTTDGSHLYTATPHEIWKINAYTGERSGVIDLPPDASGLRWGYVAETDGHVIATCMKPGAGRIKNTLTDEGDVSDNEFDRPTLRQQYTDNDYKSGRPLVCSRQIYHLDVHGQPNWQYSSAGVIPNSSIAISEDGSAIVFVEGLGEACEQHPTDRVPASVIGQQADVVCVESESGKLRWRVPLPLKNPSNILYAQIADESLMLTTSESTEAGAVYALTRLKLLNGQTMWQQRHRHLSEELGHGEQVQHPLILQLSDGKRYVFAEPYFYDLDSGEPTDPTGAAQDWALSRPGHSCGTVTGAGACLFFRATNPTVWNLNQSGDERFTKLSPSRPGCWINMIPAAGRLLIPEGSASCVCSFPLQTSMGFVPLTEDSNLPILEDFPPLAEEPQQELYAWSFNAQTTVDDKTIAPAAGDVSLTAMHPPKITTQGLQLDGTQWLAPNTKQPSLPPLPLTVSLEAYVKLAASNSEWSGMIGATEDNGDYERGCMLGINEGRFFFSLASEGKAKLTYLKSPVVPEIDRYYHVVGTYDGALMRLFVDGKLVGVTTAQSGALLPDQKSWLVVGAYKDENESYPLRGALKRAAIFRGALTPAQVRQRAKTTSDSN